MAGLFSSNEQDMLGTIMQQRNQSNQALGSGYGKYGGIVQAGAGMADIGGDAMFGGATGASDPRMIEQQEVKAIFSQASTQTGNSTSPEFYMAFSELLAAKFPEQSQKAMEQAQKVKEQAAKQADATYTENQRTNDTKVKEVIAETLAKNPEATSEQLMAAIAPFTNNPTAVIETRAKTEAKKLETAAKIEAKELENTNKVESARQKAADSLQRVREQNANTLLIAQQGDKTALAMQQIANTNKKELQAAELLNKTTISAAQASARKDLLVAKIGADREAQALKQNTTPLAPALQKVENENLASIDSYIALAKILDEPIKSLTGTATKPPLDLGPAAVLKYVTLNSTGNSTEASRAYSALQESVAQAVNIQVGNETGVQAKDDVTRFAAALVAASSKTDTVATKEALIRFQEAVKVRTTATKRNVNSQRASQNISAYFPDVQATSGTNPGTRAAPNNTSSPTPTTVSWGSLK